MIYTFDTYFESYGSHTQRAMHIDESVNEKINIDDRFIVACTQMNVWIEEGSCVETGKARGFVLMLKLFGSDQTFTFISARINYLAKCKCFNPTCILFPPSTHSSSSSSTLNTI